MARIKVMLGVGSEGLIVTCFDGLVVPIKFGDFVFRFCVCFHVPNQNHGR